MFEIESVAVQAWGKTYHLVRITNYPFGLEKINFFREFQHSGKTYRVAIIEKGSDRNNSYFVHEGNEIKFAIAKPEHNDQALPFLLSVRDFNILNKIVEKLNTWLSTQ